MSDKYDFNEIIDRRGTSSLKYDFTAERGRTDDVLPLWVADMDFRSPPSVIAAIATLSKHGIFGYSDTKEDYFNAVISWFNRRFDWNCSTEWLVKTPGVVTALALSVRALHRLPAMAMRRTVRPGSVSSPECSRTVSAAKALKSPQVLE